MAFALTWLAEVLEEAGLKVAEQPGWRTRGHSEMGVVRGVMCHHTAGPLSGNMPSLGVITNGRPDLAGPLAQLGLGRDGAFYVVAAGVAYHAGAGSWRGLTNGNWQFIGIEAENTGLGNDPWPPIQTDAYCRGVAAILKRINAPSNMCCGHKEYALPVGRKQDPSFEMNPFRARIERILAGASPPQLIPPVDEQARPTIRRGAQGPLVVSIQAKLPNSGHDGVFSAATEAAVRQFQLSKSLVPDGIVGPKTWLALN